MKGRGINHVPWLWTERFASEPKHSNSDIKVDGKTAFFKFWYGNGITKLEHLLDDKNI